MHYPWPGRETRIWCREERAQYCSLWNCKGRLKSYFFYFFFFHYFSACGLNHATSNYRDSKWKCLDWLEWGMNGKVCVCGSVRKGTPAQKALWEWQVLDHEHHSTMLNSFGKYPAQEHRGTGSVKDWERPLRVDGRTIKNRAGVLRHSG